MEECYLIKIRFFFGNARTSYNTMYRVMSCDFSFLFNCSIIYKTIKYTAQSNNSSQFLNLKDLVGLLLFSRFKS